MFLRTQPEALGVDSRGIVRFLDEMKQKGLHLHSMMMLRHGKVIMEADSSPWSKQDLHMLFSLSKSFTSSAVGFAVQDGLLQLTDRLIDFFPDYLPAAPCENMQRLQIRHLLTMNTGHHTEPRHFSDQWEADFLQSYIPHEPGTHFLYNTYGSFLLSAVVQKVTGKKLLAYLREKLLDPLEMSSDIWTEESPSGVATGGYGMNVRLEDIAKFGQLYLQRGEWEGRQLLSRQWVQDAQTAWSDNSDPNGGPASDWGSGYGYQFWMCKPDHVYRGDGAFGQFCVILPDQDMVIAINSGVNDMGAVLNGLWTHILPCVDVPCEPSGLLAERLKDTETAAHWEENDLAVTPPLLDAAWFGRYEFQAENPFGVQSLCVNGQSLQILTQEGQYDVPLCMDHWVPAVYTSEAVLHNNWSRVSARAAMHEGDLLLHLCLLGTPFEDVLRIHFTRHGLQLQWQRNVGFGDQNSFRLIGCRAD